MDEHRYYQTGGVSLQSLVSKFSPNLVKLDIEGAEYQIYRQCFGVRQVCIEFHHHCVPRFKLEDTERAVKEFLDFGYKMLYRSGHDEITFLLQS